MKKIKYLLLAGCLFLASCGEDFLDRQPISNMGEPDFYKTEEDFDNAIIGVYATLYKVYASDSPMAFVGQLMSDQCYTTNTAGNVSDLLGIQNVDVKPVNTIIRGWWTDYYACLYRANKFLASLEQVDIPKKTQYEQEVRFFRALYYFNMVRIWGGVPLVTKPVTHAEAYEYGRATVDQVYTQILEDLTIAVQLPATARFKGGITQGAAYTLLGEVHLTMGDKGKAAAALQQVYGKYQLETKYADLWSLTNKNCEESIFEVQWKGGSGNPYSRYWGHYAPLDNMGEITTWGTGYNQVTDDLWNDYEPNDPRRAASIFYQYVGKKTGKIFEEKFPAKWVDVNAPISGGIDMCDNNFIVYRYADVLLMLTEATGDPKYLNEVRGRVGMPLWGTPQYPLAKYPTLELAVEHERNVELALEFHRFFDLKRTGRAKVVLEACQHKGLTNLDVRKFVLPIPDEVVMQNPEKIIQDDVYKDL